MTTLADEECHSDYFADRPERDLPSASELGGDCLQPHLCRSRSCWICSLPGPMEGF